MSAHPFPVPSKLALAIALALAGPAAQAAADCSVTVADDDGTGGTVGTLSWAIMTANNNATPTSVYPSGHPGGGCLNNVITLTTNVRVMGVMKRLIDSDVTLQSDATTRTIDGGNRYRPLFVKSGNVTIKNLNLINSRSAGGRGATGGAGAGLGGALFVYNGTVTIDNVGFSGNGALGGTIFPGSGGAGGGGMFGKGLVLAKGLSLASGGLFGHALATGNAGTGYTYFSGYGGYGTYGGSGGTSATPNGGFGGGGANGGNGGFGGGGSGGGGNGGFGGGGGYAANSAGAGGSGGFGGGGGGAFTGAAQGLAGLAGFGGGTGGLGANAGGDSGGGGAGLGGAIFLKRGTLNLKNVSFTGNWAIGGSGGANNGQGKGGAVFICTADLDTDNAPKGAMGGCSGRIDETASYGVTFSGGTAAEGQPDLFWTGAGGGAHGTAGMTDIGTVIQTITFGAAPVGITAGGTAQVSASGGASSNPVTFTSQTPTVCTSGVTNTFWTIGQTYVNRDVTALAAGTCIIAADQAGDANYNAAPQVTQSLSIGMGTQTIALGPPLRVPAGGTSTYTAVGGGSGNPVTFISQTPGTCITGGANGSLITGVAAGTCTIAANQAGNASYTAAAQVTQNLTIGGTLPACAVTVATDDGTGATPGTLSWAIMTANNGTPTATYPAGHPGGGCLNNLITLKTQVTLTGVMTRLIDSDVTLQSDATTRTISGGTLYRPLFVKSGTVAIRNLNLNNGKAKGGDGGGGGGGAGLGGALFVYKGNVTVDTVGFSGNVAQGGNTSTVGGYFPENGGGGGMFGSSIWYGGGLFGNAFKIASKRYGGYGGTGSYGGRSGSSANKNGGFGGGGVYGGFAGFGGGGAGFLNRGGAGGFGGGGGYATTSNGIGGDGGFGGGGGRGTTAATQGNGGFAGANGFNVPIGSCDGGGSGGGLGGAIFVKQGTLSLKTVSFSGNSAIGGTAKNGNNGQGKGGALFICTSDLDTDNTPKGAMGGCSSAIDETASSGVTLSGGVAAGGQADLFWTGAGAGAHSTAGIVDSAGLTTQTIAFGAAPTVLVGMTGSVSATGGGSGNPVTFSSQTASVCTVSGNTVTGVTAGTCTVVANQAGNANYGAAPQITQTITVGKGVQTIAFGTAPSVAVGGTGTLTATGGNSGNPVTFSSQTTGVCTVSGSTVTGVTAGTCTIAADQTGNANYNAAQPATQSFVVSPFCSQCLPSRGGWRAILR